MFEAVRNAWKIEDLRKKIIFTLLMIVVFRLGCYIPVPGIDSSVIATYINSSTLFGFMDVMSGGALSSFSIFAMGITPYINSSIILTLLTVVIPALERISKEGAEGRKKISQITRYLTVGLGLLQAVGMTVGFRNAVTNPGIWTYLVIVMTLCAGTAFVMWIGEQITDKGLGNGISIIIFAGIISSFPSMFVQVIALVFVNPINIIWAVLFFIFAALTVVGMIAVTQGQRKIPVQYAKRVVGRKMFGGQSTFLPLKVNQAGVIPVIFASSLLMFPATIAVFLPKSKFAVGLSNALSPDGWLYFILYVGLIIAFTYFYTAITFNPDEMSDNLKKYGGFIPGVRAGYATTKYLKKVMSRVTLVGAIFLAVIAVVPNILYYRTVLQINFGGTSMLIAVGVALELMNQIESQMTMRHYKGFMK